MKRIILILVLIQIPLSLFLVWRDYEIEKEIGKIKESITWHMGDIEEKLFYLENSN